MRPPSANRKVDRPGGRHPSEADWMRQALRIKTAAFRHGEVTGQESGARSKRDGWRQATGDQDLTSPPIRAGWALVSPTLCKSAVHSEVVRIHPCPPNSHE